MPPATHLPGAPLADYIDIDAAKTASGLRRVLTARVPGAPWTEAPEAVFDVKRTPFRGVAQRTGKTDEALREWTGHVNAPIAEDERPRCRAALPDW